MKNIITIYIVLIVCLISSCKKGFLKESSKDTVRPTTTDALSQLLTGEAYPIDMAFHAYIDILTDDVQMNYRDEASYIVRANQYLGAYGWQADMFDKMQQAGASNYSTYSNYYQKIKGCNVVLDNLAAVIGPEAEKNNLKGQALALRAYFYFMLVNLYGKPYHHPATNLDTDLGVPLVLSAAITNAPIKRASLREVYQQMETDLITSFQSLPEMNTSNSVYRMTKTSAALLLSRLYLYMNDWDNCIKYADYTIQTAPALKDLNTLSAAFAINNPALPGNEVLWAYGIATDYSVVGSAPSSTGKAPYALSDDLLGSYESNDLRLDYYFLLQNYGTVPVKYRGSSNKGSGGNKNAKALRTSEAYLNRAEAYIQKAMNGSSGIQNALNDLNTLRKNRIKTVNYTPIAITDPNSLFAFCKAERRRELFSEDHRWFDLRRWGMPKLVHLYQDGPDLQTLSLNQGDTRYTLRFSQDDLNRNSDLKQNP